MPLGNSERTDLHTVLHPLYKHGMSFFHRLYATDSRGFVISRFVRTVRRNVKLTLILCFGSNRNAFYLYRATSAVCSSTLVMHMHGYIRDLATVRNYQYTAVFLNP